MLAVAVSGFVPVAVMPEAPRAEGPAPVQAAATEPSVIEIMKVAAEKEAKRVAERLAFLRRKALYDLGQDVGEEWLRTPLAELSGRSVEQAAAGDLAGWELSIAEEDLKARIEDLQAKNRQDQERRERIEKVTADATVTFGSREGTQAWMRSRIPELQNRWPEEACADKAGADECLALLKILRSRPAARRR